MLESQKQIKVEELIKYDEQYIQTYRKDDDYLMVVKSQGTYETYTSKYIHILNDQFKQQRNKEKESEYKQYKQCFIKEKNYFFTNIYEEELENKLYLVFRFKTLHSSNLTNSTNIGEMFGLFLHRYPNFSITIEQCSIVIRVCIDLDDLVQVQDNTKLLEELKYRSELLQEEHSKVAHNKIDIQR